MKHMLTATLFLALIGTNSAVAELAIDGNDYEETIPVTINNFDEAEAAVACLR
jgi:hypothetical protein